MDTIYFRADVKGIGGTHLMEQIQDRQNNKLWTKHFIMVLFVSFFMSITMNMQGSTLSMYVEHIGGSKSAVGIATGILTMAALLFRSVFGNLTDNKGRRLVLLVGVSILSFVSLSYTFATTITMLLALRFLQGIGLSAQSTAVGTIISDIVPPSKLGAGVGYNGIAATAATAIGPALGMFLIQRFDYNIFYIITFVFGAMALLFSFPLKYEKNKSILNKKAVSSEAFEKRGKKNVIFEASALPASLIVFFIMFTASSIFAFIPSYAASVGVKGIGIFFTVYAITFFINRTMTDKLTRKFGTSKIILSGMVILTASFLILSLARSLPLFLIGAVLYGIGFSSTQPTLNAQAVSLCAPDRRGVANSTFFSAMDIGYSLGAFAWGFVSQQMSFTYMYLGSILCIMFSIMLYGFMVVNRASKSSKAVLSTVEN
jgi:MFS family permease